MLRLDTCFCRGKNFLMFRRFEIWRLLWLPFTMTAIIALSLPAFSQDSKSVSVQLAPYKDHLRLTIDFNRLTAYRAREKDGDIVVTLDSEAPLSLPAAQGNVRLSSSLANGITTLVIGTGSGATFKDYRLGKKVVVDVFPGARTFPSGAGVKKEEPPKPKTAEKETAPATLLPEEKGAPPPPEKEEPKKPVEPTVAEVSKALADKMPQAAAVPPTPVASSPLVVDVAPPETAAPVAPQTPAVPDPTVITLSTVEPTRLAVFKRFGTLWIVMDTEAAGAIAPSASGPEAGLLGNAKITKFKGGTAYRYTLPPDRFLSAEKENLTWRVMLSTVNRQAAVNNLVNVVFDDASGKARLMADLKESSKVLELQDPSVGDTLEVVATTEQSQRIDQPRRYADLEIIPAAIGMALRPLNEGLKLTRIENYVLITAPNGITATPGATAGPTVVASTRNRHEEARLFDFPNWRQGGLTQLYKNMRAIQGAIATAEKPEDRTALLMKLALLYFANSFGHETLGVLRVIQDDTPEMVKNPNFIALRGAAAAMAGHYVDALKDLSFPAIQQHGEVSLWIGYAAAATEQWKMANRSFPPDNYLLLQYPDTIAVPFTIYMAESALRLGKTDTANSLLSSLDTMQGGFDKHFVAAINYLKGEAARQNGNAAEAIRLWRPVAVGLDRLYHTKASLALANLRLREKMIDVKQAIEELDSLRFAWRGDGLEVQILHNLGLLKVQDKKFLAGLEDMKTAAALSDNLLDDSQPIKDDMAKVFADLFIGGKTKDAPPLESVSIYNGFSEYMPGGEEGALATLNFADNLIAMDLLEKAAKLLDDQLKSGFLPAARAPQHIGLQFPCVF